MLNTSHISFWCIFGWRRKVHLQLTPYRIAAVSDKAVLISPFHILPVWYQTKRSHCITGISRFSLLNGPECQGIQHKCSFRSPRRYQTWAPCCGHSLPEPWCHLGTLLHQAAAILVWNVHRQIFCRKYYDMMLPVSFMSQPTVVNIDISRNKVGVKMLTRDNKEAGDVTHL